MNIFSTIFNKLLYQPLFNALILLYEYLPGQDFGLAIIVLTFGLRLLLSPLMAQSIKSQKELSKIQPKLEEIQEKYKDDQEKQAEEIMNLYQKENFNPFGSLLPLLIQLPVLIALFQLFQKGIQPQEMTSLYNFVPHPGDIKYSFLGSVGLSNPNMLLAGIASVLQFFQFQLQNSYQKTKQSDKKSGAQFMKTFQKQMPYFFAGFTFIILMKLPAALALYWMVTSLFSMGQQYVIQQKYD